MDDDDMADGDSIEDDNDKAGEAAELGLDAASGLPAGD